jgi:hypothetical protein
MFRTENLANMPLFPAPSMGKVRNACRILVGKPEMNISLGVLRRRWESNIKIYLIEVGWCGVDWMHVIKGRIQLWPLTNEGMNIRVP